MNVRKLVRLLDYTNDRSLQQRLRRWRAEQPQLRRERLWRKRTAVADRFAYKLERGATINLYRDDALSKLLFVEGFELVLKFHLPVTLPVRFLEKAVFMLFGVGIRNGIERLYSSYPDKTIGKT